MKLNFWQWLGIICVAIGLIGYLVLKSRDTTESPAQPPATVPATTQPAINAE